MDSNNITERDYRCPKCGRLNFRGYLAPGSFVKMRCYRDRCRAWLLIEPGKRPIILDTVDVITPVDTLTLISV